MNEDTRWKLIAGMALVTLSLALYTAHYLIFQDAHHVVIYLLGDIAFIPLEVFVVTLIIDQMLEAREKKQRMEKLNMVIGTFFSTTGTPLLSLLSRADPCIDTLRPSLVVRDSWTDNDFVALKSTVGHYSCGVQEDQVDFDALRTFLLKNEEFMMRLVENPMIFEHESFTDLILAISHLTEELKSRGSLASLPPEDIIHLGGDCRRVYSLLVPEWVRYMEYLRAHYPYLFSLAMRKNPFDTSASVVIGKAA
ncbi:MAG: hypothetical protein LUQ35_07790 [Methanoregula sp.]|jgi:hypothetical protein|nr:hypothetical protein [Methanoregula sp.]